VILVENVQRYSFLQRQQFLNKRRKAAFSSQEGSITMVDRASSSRRDSSASLPNRDITRILFRQSSDHQASTSSNLPETTRLGSESRERQSSDGPDQLQKRFQDLLAELENSPHVSKETLEKYKQEFQGKSNESERKEYIEDLEKQLEIDKVLGNIFFINKSENELTADRKFVLDFLSAKIQNSSDTRDKRKIFEVWRHAIDYYCMDHSELLKDNSYRTVAKDMMHCDKIDRDQIQELIHEDDYQGPKHIVHDAITAINESLYTEQERVQLLAQNRAERVLEHLQLAEALARREVEQQHDFHNLAQPADLQTFARQVRERLRTRQPEPRPNQQLAHFHSLETRQQRDYLRGLARHELREFYLGFDTQQRSELSFHINYDLHRHQRLELYQDLDTPQLRQEFVNTLNYENLPRLYLDLNHDERRELVQGLDSSCRQSLYRDLAPQQQRELVQGLDPQQLLDLYKQELVQGLNSSWRQSLYRDLAPQQQRELVQGLNPQQRQELYLGLDRQQQRDLHQGLSFQQRLKLVQGLNFRQQRELYGQQLKRMWQSCIPVCGRPS
jgi:hypothetical protein